MVEASPGTFNVFTMPVPAQAKSPPPVTPGMTVCVKDGERWRSGIVAGEPWAMEHVISDRLRTVKWHCDVVCEIGVPASCPADKVYYAIANKLVREYVRIVDNDTMRDPRIGQKVKLEGISTAVFIVGVNDQAQFVLAEVIRDHHTMKMWKCDPEYLPEMAIELWTDYWENRISD